MQVYEPASGVTFTVPPGGNQSNNPAWSVNGTLAWTDGAEEANQVFILADGKPVQVTHSKTGVIAYRWAPDGLGLYYLAQDNGQKKLLNKRRELHPRVKLAENKIPPVHY